MTAPATLTSDNIIFERTDELAELHRRIRSRNSCLVHGESGAGKTLLIRSVVREFPRVLYCYNSETGQFVFRSLATELLRCRDKRLRHACGRMGELAIKEKSILALRGLVLESLHAGEYWVILDHLSQTSAGLASDVRDMMLWANTPVMAVARSNHMEDLGFLTSYFALRSERMQIRPFNYETAIRFAEQIAQHVGFAAINRNESLQKIVELSHGLPGQIVSLIQMALGPKYRTNDYVKVSCLYIDFRLAWHAANAL